MRKRRIILGTERKPQKLQPLRYANLGDPAKRQFGRWKEREVLVGAGTASLGDLGAARWG